LQDKSNSNFNTPNFTSTSFKFFFFGINLCPNTGTSLYLNTVTYPGNGYQSGKKKLYLITHSFFKIYDRSGSKYVFPAARFFFNFRKRTYPLCLDAIQNS